MIYIVTGNMRSGTSMMMHAVGQSMPLVYDDIGEWQGEGYKPQPHDFYDCIDTKNVPGFPDIYAGQAVKIFIFELLKMPVGDTPRSVVYMERPIQESLESFYKAFNYPRDGVPPAMREDHEYNMQALRELGYSVLHVKFRDVIEDPYTQFKRLAYHGWPIDIGKAALTVDPNWYRVRLCG